MINCATEVSSSGLFLGVQYYSEDIKHRINNLSHSSEWNMSLSGYFHSPAACENMVSCCGYKSGLRRGLSFEP